jgi:hypothetical protein
VRRGLVPVGWLLADAALVALPAGLAETLLLFLVSPDIALTLGGFAATFLALLPQIVVAFVLPGPVLVLLATALAFGRTTRLGLSTRYILRFALLDAVLLLAASAYQWVAVGGLLPPTARVALALTMSTMGLAALAAAAMILVEARRPAAIGPPVVVALAVAVLVALAAAAVLRRVKTPPPVPIDAPGFRPARAALIVEVPGLDPADFDLYVERGNAEAFEELLARGSRAGVRPGVLADPLALHATLITGQPPREHGVLGSVRYQPSGSRRSFGILPRGLFLRPLLRTPLWRRVPVDHRAVSTVALPQIARSLGLSEASIGDPLDWPALGPGSLSIPAAALAQDGSYVVDGEVVSCLAPVGVDERFFDPPASELPVTPRLAQLVTDALAEDACALRLAAAAVHSGNWPLVHVRLEGHYRVAYMFAGWRDDRPARGVSDREIKAFGRTLTRYVRELAPLFGELWAAADGDGLVALVSPHGIAPRQDFERLVSELFGATVATGTHAGPPSGFLVIAGPGVRGGGEHIGTVALTSILPTVLWAQALPAAEDMGPIFFGPFEREFVAQHPVIAVPSYGRTLTADTVAR